MTEVERILMDRDDLSAAEAARELKRLKARVKRGADPEDVLYSIGLEPDYIFDLMDAF